MSGKLSRRSAGVDPFIVMDVMAAAAEKEAAGDVVIHLEVGQPSTPAPMPPSTRTGSDMSPRSECRHFASELPVITGKPTAPTFPRNVWW